MISTPIPDGFGPDDEVLEFCRLLTLQNLDNEFYKNPDALVINNDTLISPNLSEEFNNIIYNQTEGEIGFVPTCQCGNLRGPTKIGLLCPKCHTICSDQFIDNLAHNTWIEFSKLMPTVIHPTIYLILRNWSHIGRSADQSIIDICLDPRRSVPIELKDIVKEQGFIYFNEHYEEILEFLETNYPKTASKPTAKSIHTLIQNYHECFFTRHLPLLHNSLHPKKSNGDTLNYIDEASLIAVQGITDLSNLSYRVQTNSIRKRQLNIALYKVYTAFVSYYKKLLDTKLGKKYGLLRKHNFGSRFHYSLRTVVVPHDHVTSMDEVILPWGIMVNGLKLLILNYLVHRDKLSVNNALTRFNCALTNYDPRIEEILHEIIYNYPDHRLPVLIGRNPTIEYGSIMLLFVREFKTDPKDQTLAISATIVGPANIDFDGDELYGIYIFENQIKEAFKTIHPSQFLFDVASAGFSSRIGLLNQNVVCLENYLAGDTDSDYYEELD